MKQFRNSFLYLSATIANLLGFVSGIAYAWSSPVLPKLNGSLEPENNPLGRSVTPSEESWIVGLLSMGAIFGPMAAGLVSDKIGRKKTLLILACPIFASSLMMAFANGVLIFYIARFVLGLGVGGVYMILPMYLVEIAEDHNRGTLGCLMGVFITSGLLFAFAVGPYLTIQNFCLVCSVPVLIFIPLFSMVNPESPQYLAAINDQEQLKISLSKLRNKSPEAIEKDMFAISGTIQQLNENKNGIGTLFATPSLRNGLTITVGLIILQQLAGINAVLSYMQSIFDATGSGLSPEISSVIIGAIQVCSTILTSSLADRLGRRILLLTSITGSGFSLISLGIYFYFLNHGFAVEGISWLPLLSLVLFIIFFNLGMSSVPFTVMAELFPPEVKSIALTITTVVLFIGAFVITLCFPSLSLFLGMAVSFWVFAGFCAVGVVFVYFKVPETKGRSLQEIQRLLEGRS